MFQTYSQKGFQVKFDNGFTVSVMFGAGNYCDNRHCFPVETEHQSPDAEIAVIGPDGEFRSDFPGCPEYDQVQGWVTPEQMLTVMNWAAFQTV